MDKIFLLTIDEDLRGDLMIPITDELYRLGIKATIFIDFRTKMSKEYAKKLISQGFECQLHWIRFPVRTKKSFYLRREVSFEDQKAIIEKLIGQPITGNRTHGLEFRGPNFVYPWEIMRDNNIVYSSTTFGIPINHFSPIDLKGEPYGLSEIPITHYETIPTNAYHFQHVRFDKDELICGLYHPHYENWKPAVEWGLKNKYTFKTITQYLRDLSPW